MQDILLETKGDAETLVLSSLVEDAPMTRKEQE
jgi:hypothetical protein